MRQVVIVGASVAGVTAADTLRQLGYDGAIILVGGEAHPPYVRPPLSKAVLSGAESPQSVLMPALRADVTLRSASPAVALDTAARRVRLAGGDELPYDGLVVATGARARRLGPPGLAGELVMRDLDDAVGLRDAMGRAGSVLVVGGGFLGMEVASIASAMGLTVTVVDAEPPLVRQFGRYLAAHLTAAARAAGVRLVQAPGGVELVGGPSITAAKTAAGDLLEADLVVSAVGCQPNVEWLASAGLGSPAGLLVDERCRVRPDVVAAGDVVATAHGGARPRRTPHWASAIDQARCAAHALLAGDDAPPYQPRPYFWTEQWGLEIKICGEPPTGAAPDVLAGSLEENEALLRWTRDGVAVAAATLNHRMPLVKLRKLATTAV
jgi:NADPH-dependent 2,4-dienoyl-CoA reductase/sulfur reductase-like enzyme